MIYLAGCKNENITNIEIQDWFGYLDVEYSKILPIDLLDSGTSSLNEKDVLWLWKGDVIISKDDDPLNNKETYSYVNNELKTLYSFIISKSHKYPELDKVSLNKLVVLELAQTLEIDIPAYCITTKKKELMKFFILEKSIITKPMYEVDSFSFGDRIYNLYTEKLTIDTIEKMPNLFFPSFFQTCIDKEYEIRTFYLDNKFYSMAIFSASDSQTEIDFRKYNHSAPNRNVPYQLPKEIENKIKLLMDKLKLNTGSIDLIKGVNGKYYFLEINPVGQIGMTSKPCNYYIEKKIVQHLNKVHNEKFKQ